MPYGWGSSAAFTSGDPGAGRAFTRFRGPILLGDIAAASGWPIGSTTPPHIANVSTQLADCLVVPAGSGNFISSSTGSISGMLYLSQTTYGMSSSTNANVAATPTPGIAGGAAIVFDSARKKLSVFSTVTGDWLSVSLTSS